MSKTKKFERKTGFFVKKSEKKLTVPMCPNLSCNITKTTKDNYNDPWKDFALLNFSVGINERRPLHFNSGQKNKHGATSGTASTNASRSRASSKSKAKPSLNFDSAKKSEVDVKQIGTHNDNFLCSFVSLRQSDKKQEKPKQKLIEKQLDEFWFSDIINFSFDSDLPLDEYQSMVMKLIPEYVGGQKPTSYDQKDKDQSLQAETNINLNKSNHNLDG